MGTIKKYKERSTGAIVRAFKYTNIDSFDTLRSFIGDIYPTITKAHTRIYEDNWIIRYDDNRVIFISCKPQENCFENRFEVFNN